MIGLNINFMRQLIHVASKQPVKTGDRIFMNDTLIEVTDYNIPDLVKICVLDFTTPVVEKEAAKCPQFINPKHVDTYNRIVCSYANCHGISEEEVEEHLNFLYYAAPHALMSTLLFELGPLVDECQDGIWYVNTMTGDIHKTPYRKGLNDTFAAFASFKQAYEALEVIEPLYEELYGE